MVVLWILSSLAVVVVLTLGAQRLGRMVKQHRHSAAIDPSGRTFPDGFIWFTGEDAYQHEGGNRNNDWARMEESPDTPVPGGERNEMAADFFRRYEEDFDVVQRDGHQAHRIGVEWSRIEPERGRYDEAALATYQAMLESLRRRGLQTFFNIWHFTLPLWAADDGGFESERVMADWQRLVRMLARRFGPMVDFWSTMIDSQIYALRGYGVGEIPPRVRDMKRALWMYEALVRAHAHAYRIIKDETEDAPVGQIYFFDIYESAGGPLDAFITRRLDSIFNWAYLGALRTGRLSVSVPGGPSLRTEIPEAAGTLDWLGVNYYRRQIISVDLKASGGVRQETLPGVPTTDMGWEIYPEGLFLVLERLSRRYPELPLYITESGLADADDSRRPRYITDHLAWVHEAISRGVPVRGFSYWSLTDNWEWIEGSGPKFGLYAVDLATGARTPRPSARLFSWITRNNRLPDFGQMDTILTGGE